VKLYYFTSQQYALESLRDKRLKIARFSELNDPFDFMGLALDYYTQRHYLNLARDEADKAHGIICMSTSWQEPLLWGHYADKHKGICLGFDVVKEDWKKVRYVKSRPTLQSLGVSTLLDMSDEQWETVSLTKFKAWSYEREFRRLVDLGEPDLVSSLHFQPFSDAMRLREVIFGYRSTVGEAMLNKLCLHVGGSVEVFQARPAFREFKIVRRQNGFSWA